MRHESRTPRTALAIEAELLAGVVPLIHAITERISITNVVTANDTVSLCAAGFTPDCILCLDRTSQSRYAADGRKVIALVDGKNEPDVFARAVAMLDDLLRSHERVLVHCHAGRSRSIVVVAAHLAKAQAMSPGEALAYVSARRPCASVMPGLIENLHRYCAAG